MLNWILGLILFGLAVWAIANIINSKEDTAKKIIWIIVVLVFPFLGIIAWYFFGPKSALKM